MTWVLIEMKMSHAKTYHCSGAWKMIQPFSFNYQRKTNDFITSWINRMIITRDHFIVFFAILNKYYPKIKAANDPSFQ